ncbi:MAG: hypothetical protein JKY63_03810 [Rhodobiaceae bacterium]|nr:hypothetical protein [Rhodobiaceae bacterium]
MSGSAAGGKIGILTALEGINLMNSRFLPISLALLVGLVVGFFLYPLFYTPADGTSDRSVEGAISIESQPALPV